MGKGFLTDFTMDCWGKMSLRAGTTIDNSRSPCEGSDFLLLSEFEGVINLDATVTDRVLLLTRAEIEMVPGAGLEPARP